MNERGLVIRFRTTCQGLALALVLTIATAATPAQAANDAAIGASSGVCSLLYAPAKLAFAGLGSVVSGLAYLMTGFDSDVARPIFYAAVRGDYVITPAHLEGRRVVEFVGRDPRDDPPPTPEVW